MTQLLINYIIKVLHGQELRVLILQLKWIFVDLG